jgi:hypothetical protein
VLYEDDQLQITCNVQQIKYLFRLMLTFTGKNGAHPQNLMLQLQNVAGDSNLMAQCSPVRYSQDGSAPQAIVMAMMSQAFDYAPELNVYLEILSMGYTFNNQIRIPIYVNRFIEKVEMPLEAFSKNWYNITHNQPDTFQKVDKIVKNPAPPHVPIDKVIAQLENFFSNAMGMKVYVVENILYAVGQVVTQPASQSTFPSNPNDMGKPENVPLMMQV